MKEERDLYEILGVGRSDDRETIRKAYRKLARQNHPDLNPGDKTAEERFKQISRAWAVLEDDEKRRNYDEFGEVSLESGFDPEQARQAQEAFRNRFHFEGGSRGQGRDFDGSYHFEGIDDVFGDLFGGRASASGRQVNLRGSDLEAHLEIDFLDAMRGGEKKLTLARQGRFGYAEPETLNVRIPPGVDSGTRLRLKGKGAPGYGEGPAGDLHVEIQVRPHPVFGRQGRNLTLDVPITVREAILGAKIEVPTLDGHVTLTVPPSTQNGSRLRLRGKGVPDPRGGAAGDLLVRVEVRIPTKLDEASLDAIRELDCFDDPALRKELDR